MSSSAWICNCLKIFIIWMCLCGRQREVTRRRVMHLNKNKNSTEQKPHKTVHREQKYTSKCSGHFTSQQLLFCSMRNKRTPPFNSVSKFPGWTVPPAWENSVLEFFFNLFSFPSKCYNKIQLMQFSPVSWVYGAPDNVVML